MSKQLKLPTLLVVTNNPSIRFWIKKHLDEEFFILNAETHREAIDALNARLDFIIIDAAFEEADTLELCQELSKLTQKGIIPILLITGRLKKSFREKAMSSGVTDFLSDQLDAEELQARIAAGTKAASARQRTQDLGLSIKPHLLGSSSLKNKIFLNNQALKLLALAKDEGSPVALLMVRIDKMETSETLAAFSTFIGRFLEEKDVLIQTPENGLVVLLYNRTVEKARQLAEKIRKETQMHDFKIAFSIVVSSMEASEKGFNRMIESAAKSLKTHSETNLIISLDQENL